jgi:DNA repair protein RecN (Recombination protein N)
MLSHIYVKDLVIVSTLELELSGGMTALTGETGAGKSILIDALGLTLGEKSDNAMIRTGCGRAEVSAEFDLTRHPEATAWMEAQGLDDAGHCILRRLLVRTGRSRAYINGRPVPLQQLQALGALLVDIHGQHEHQSLLRAGEQRRLLDEYAGAAELALQVADRFRDYRAARIRLEELQAQARDRISRLELLAFQRDELEALAVTAEELQELDREQRRLHNTGRLQETSARLLQNLYDDEHSIQSGLNRAVMELDELLAFSSHLGEPRELIEGAMIQVQEAAGALRDFADGLEPDPQRLEHVEQRLSDIHDSARKYRSTPEELPARLEEIHRELAVLESADLELEQLERQVAGLREDYLTTAAKLSRRRQEAAARLSETVSAAMQTMGMDGGRLEVRVEALEEEKAGATGLDAVAFLVNANPGQPLQLLAKVASGGELSRISLGIQVATAECGRVPTLIFDEVDVGIGGGVAEIVGQLLRRLGDARQILCVTHLPQVAAQAHRQLQVKKQTEDGQTYTGIAPLTPKQRVEEVARMLGGVEITKKTLAHAREMLAAEK